MSLLPAVQALIEDSGLCYLISLLLAVLMTDHTFDGRWAVHYKMTIPATLPVLVFMCCSVNLQDTLKEIEAITSMYLEPESLLEGFLATDTSKLLAIPGSNPGTIIYHVNHLIFKIMSLFQLSAYK